MASTRNTYPKGWKTILRLIGVAVMVSLSACTATDHPRAPLSHARTSRGMIRPAPDRILSQGEIAVAEAHLRDFGYDAGPIDGLYTAETQAAVRAFQARDGLPVSGRLDRDTRVEWLPGLDHDAFDP